MVDTRQAVEKVCSKGRPDPKVGPKEGRSRIEGIIGRKYFSCRSSDPQKTCGVVIGARTWRGNGSVLQGEISYYHDRPDSLLIPSQITDHEMENRCLQEGFDAEITLRAASLEDALSMLD